MLTKLKEDYGLSLLEFFNVLLVLSLVYGCLYKIGFYNNLGINWVLGSLPLNYIVLTSIKYISCLFIGICLGVIVENKLKETPWYLKFIFVFPLILLTLIVLVNFFMNSVTHILGDKTVIIFFILNILQVFQFSFLYSQLRKMEKPNWLIFILSLAIPLSIGALEANSIKKSPEYFVNKVQLNNGEKNWYLIEMLNEKAILKRDGKDKVYRIVDSKDIKYLEDTNHN